MNATVYPLLAAWTTLGIALFPLLWLGWKVATRWRTDRIIRHLIWVYGRGWLVIISPFVRFRREGFAGEPIPDRCILVINHLSFFDTFFMGALPFSNVAFAVRAWPFRMFWYAGFMRLARYLDVESASWEESLEAGRRVLDDGGRILFFPEGHRSRDGKLQRFYSGAFRLAVETGTTVVPLCITGTDLLLPPGRNFLSPARVRLRALPAVDPTPFKGEGGHLEMRRLVKAQMTGVLEQMRAEEGSMSPKARQS